MPEKPEDLRWSRIAGAGVPCGIGFMMSFFIADLAGRRDAALTKE